MIHRGLFLREKTCYTRGNIFFPVRISPQKIPLYAEIPEANNYLGLDSSKQAMVVLGSNSPFLCSCVIPCSNQQLLTYLVVYLYICVMYIFSSPGRSPGRAIVLPPASELVLAKSLTLKFFM